MGRRGFLVLITAAAAAGVAIGGLLAFVHRGSARALPATAVPLGAQATWPAGARPAPAFRLRDQDGRLLALRAERGRPVLLTFLDSRCRGECPIQGRLLASVQRRLGSASHAALLVVSVDPWADNAASVHAFAAKAWWRGNWHWLLGSRAQLARVWRSYGVGVRRVRMSIDHTAVLYLLDREGYERAAYLVPFSSAAVAAGVRGLAAS